MFHSYNYFFYLFYLYKNNILIPKKEEPEKTLEEVLKHLKKFFSYYPVTFGNYMINTFENSKLIFNLILTTLNGLISGFIDEVNYKNVNLEDHKILHLCRSRFYSKTLKNMFLGSSISIIIGEEKNIFSNELLKKIDKEIIQLDDPFSIFTNKDFIMFFIYYIFRMKEYNHGEHLAFFSYFLDITSEKISKFYNDGNLNDFFNYIDNFSSKITVEKRTNYETSINNLATYEDILNFFESMQEN